MYQSVRSCTSRDNRYFHTSDYGDEDDWQLAHDEAMSYRRDLERRLQRYGDTMDVVVDEVEHRRQWHVMVFLNELGERKLAALEAGFAWDKVAELIDETATRDFYMKPLMHNDSFPQSTFDTIKALDNPFFQDIKRAYFDFKISAEYIDGVWRRQSSTPLR